ALLQLHVSHQVAHPPHRTSACSLLHPPTRCREARVLRLYQNVPESRLHAPKHTEVGFPLRQKASGERSTRAPQQQFALASPHIAPLFWSPHLSWSWHPTPEQ